MRKRTAAIVCLLTVIAVVAIDRITKNLVVENMTLGQAIPDPNAFFTIRYTLNQGIAFSLLENIGNPLIAVQFLLIAFVLGMIVWFTLKQCFPLPLISLSMMLGGGIGNIIDRIQIGAVTDFFSVGNFPIFNMADACLTVGCALLFISIVHSDRKKAKSQEERKDNE